MTPRTALKIMRAAFGRLTDVQRERLRFHAAKGTGICCGSEWRLFVRVADGAG